MILPHYQDFVNNYSHFTSVNVDWSWKVHDIRIFKNSCLFSLDKKGDFPAWLTTWTLIMSAFFLLTWEILLYPLLLWLSAPFIGHFDHRRELFSNCCSCRMKMECDFRTPRGKWWSLDTGKQYLPWIIIYAVFCTMLVGEIERTWPRARTWGSTAFRVVGITCDTSPLKLQSSGYLICICFEENAFMFWIYNLPFTLSCLLWFGAQKVITD